MLAACSVLICQSLRENIVWGKALIGRLLRLSCFVYFFLEKLAEICLLLSLFVCVQTVNSEISFLRDWDMRNVTSSLGKIITTAIQSLQTTPHPPPPLFVPEVILHKRGLCSWQYPCFDTYLCWLNNQVLTRSTCVAWRTAAASPKCRLARNKGCLFGLIFQAQNKQLEGKMSTLSWLKDGRQVPSQKGKFILTASWWWFAGSLFEGSRLKTKSYETPQLFKSHCYSAAPHLESDSGLLQI